MTKIDSSDFKKEFISEARDHLDTLNEGLVELEKNSDNADNINELFRAFHSLKGNAAAMGYSAFSELSHALEDLLGKIRDKELDVNQDVMDVLFDGCDTLEDGLDQISQDNPDAIEVESLIVDVKRIMGIKEEEVKDVKIKLKFEPTDDETKKVKSLKSKKNNIFRVITLFGKDNFLKGAKASILYRDLSNISEIISTTPSSDDIKQNKFTDEIEIVIATKSSKEDVDKIVSNVSDITFKFILSQDEDYLRPKEADEAIKKIDEMNKIASENKSKSTTAVKKLVAVKVEMDKLDKMMNLVGEMLISNIRLQSLVKSNVETNGIGSVLPIIDRLTTDLHDEIMKIRMHPISNVFKRFPRMVRDLATKEKKKINLTIEGDDIEFDRTVLDKIGDPLVHLLRNSIDHGIELPDVRANMGKLEEGNIKLIAKREKNRAIIEIEDDGAGIDPQIVKQSSIKKGVISEAQAQKMNDNDLRMLIFKPGVSTNKVVTDVSGRGVGMDVVKSAIEEIGGNVNLQSELGKKTLIRLNLPLSVAIITALLIKVHNDTYAIPLSNIEETVDIKEESLKSINGEKVFILRQEEIPLFWISNLLDMKPKTEDTNTTNKNLTIVIVNRGNEKIGFVVDSVIAQQQILVKSLQDIVKKVKGFSGATILGDGKVCLILDVNGLLDLILTKKHNII